MTIYHTEPGTLPNRACGPCVSCCSFFTIAELAKPAGQLCCHSMAGGGCDRYDTRPDACRVFFCAWRCWDEVPLSWRPDRTGFILGGALAPGRYLSVTVDPGQKESWRRPDCLDQLRQWARQGAEIGSQVAVFIENRVVIMLPDQELDLGIVGPDEVLIAEQIAGESGPICRISKIPRTDPRVLTR